MGKSYELENGTKPVQNQVLSDIELKKIELTTSSLSDAEKAQEEHDKFIDSSNNTTAEAPFDKKNLVFLILVIHGIGNLMPWNMFITAESYYTNYKLNVTLSDPQENQQLTAFRKGFMSIASISSQAPNLIFNGLNLFLAYYSSSLGGGVNLFKLINGSIIINILIMSFTCLLVVLDTSTWPIKFFILTIISIIILNISNGFYQNSIYGTAARLPRLYTNAVIFGNNFCGTMVSMVSIITILISPNLKFAAFLYFFSAIIILVACLITFRLLLNNEFFKHYRNLGQKTATNNKVPPTRPSYIYILKHCGAQCLNVFLTFFVTLTLFPNILSGIKQSSDIFNQTFFTPIFCFLNFNFFAMVGNILPQMLGDAKLYPKADHLWIPVCLRLLFIPLFLFCNYKPDLYPNFFGNDAYFIIGTLLMGLSHGYLSSLGMMYAPKTVSPEHAPIAGMLSAFCLICGISAGILMSMIF